MTKPLKAAGDINSNAGSDRLGIDRVLEKKGKERFLRPCGRKITTVGELKEIEALLKDGWEILWCQMSKQTMMLDEGDQDE